MSKLNEPNQMKEWLTLLGDAERAEVLKVQIAEQEKTERERITEQGQTDRDDDALVARNLRTIFFALTVMIALGCMTCAGIQYIEKAPHSLQGRP